MRVNWTLATGATSYKVERCQGAGCTNFAQIASNVLTLFYNDSGLSAGTTYRYQIRGTNTDGDGPYSGIGTQITVPAAPLAPTFSNITADAMRVNWSSVTGADSYKVERCQGAGCSTFNQIASNVTNLFYDDSGLTSLTSYSYKVRATNTAGDGAYSGTGSQTTLAAGCTFDGQPVSHGSSVTAYQDATVPYDQSCVSEQRSCNDGTLSGTYQYASCSVNPPPAANQVSGYAWSDTIGWISLDCATGGPTGNDICATKDYHLDIDASGYIIGFAWSDNIGWIQFGGLSDFPTGGGTSAQDAQIVGNTLIGWARACGGTVSGNCSSMTSRTDGWDGWISFSGTGYGVTLASGAFTPCQVGSTSCAWGDVNVGWVDFSAATAGYQACADTQGNFCDPAGPGGVSKHRDANCSITINPPNPCQWQCEAVTGLCILPPEPTVTGAGLVLSPSLVRQGQTTVVSWTVQDALSCEATGTNGDVVTVSGTNSIPITQATTYTLVCLDALGTPFEVDTARVSVIPLWQEK
jgi:hypothetical protein